MAVDRTGGRQTYHRHLRRPYLHIVDIEADATCGKVVAMVVECHVDALTGVWGEVHTAEVVVEDIYEGPNDDYWKATAANAIRPLYQLMTFAKYRPDGVWDGD